MVIEALGPLLITLERLHLKLSLALSSQPSGKQPRAPTWAL